MLRARAPSDSSTPDPAGQTYPARGDEVLARRSSHVLSSSTLKRGACVALCCALTVAIFFRYQIANGFTVLNGDRYDAVIAISLMEHWYNAFRGLAPFTETGFFYPVHDSLGYNDGYLLFGAIYSIFRAFGTDPYLAGELVNVVLRAVCFIASYFAARRILALDTGWSILAAAIATLSDNMFAQALHAQLFSVGFVPAMALVVDETARAFLDRQSGRFLLCAAIGAAFFGAWLLTAFYTAWFFLLFLSMFGLALVCLAPATRRHEWREAIVSQPGLVLVAACFVILSVLSFLAIYLPKAAETGQHIYVEALRNALSPADLANVGDGNLIYGGLFTRLAAAFGSAGPAWSERVTGMPPALLVLFVGTAVWLLRTRQWPSSKRNLTLAALAIAVLASWLLLIRVGNFSLWSAVYVFAPGAHAIRVIARYQLLLVFPVVGVGIAGLAHYSARPGLAVLALCALLLMEELNVAPPLDLHRPHELARLNAVSQPPGDCRAFYTSTARNESQSGTFVDSVYSHNVDAMIIAETQHLPTINGFGTFLPPGWFLIEPDSPSYLSSVQSYAARYRVHGLCALDLKLMRWSSPAG